jgi:hypothetical protein
MVDDMNAIQTVERDKDFAAGTLTLQDETHPKYMRAALNLVRHLSTVDHCNRLVD